MNNVKFASLRGYIRCGKCGRTSYATFATDEHSERDPHCIACGYRETREPTEREAGAERERRGRASHSGVHL